MRGVKEVGNCQVGISKRNQRMQQTCKETLSGAQVGNNGGLDQMVAKETERSHWIQDIFWKEKKPDPLNDWM